jgi:hypothetical protein
VEELGQLLLLHKLQLACIGERNAAHSGRGKKQQRSGSHFAQEQLGPHTTGVPHRAENRKKP